MEEKIRIMKTYGNVTTGSGNLLMKAILTGTGAPYKSVYLCRTAPSTEGAVSKLYNALRIMIGEECGHHWDDW